MTTAASATARGFAVFPCRVNDKLPAVPDHPSNRCMGTDPRCRNGHTGWEQRATTDPGRISRAWADTPWNIGVACGPSNLVVIDLDTHGQLPGEWRDEPGITDGKDVFTYICEAAGMDFPRDTYIVQTPSLGWHLYFRAPEGSSYRNTAGYIGPMVDTRAAGGYVVGAGSVIDGKAYEVLYDQEVQPLPRWIARLLEPEEPKPDRSGPVPGDSPKNVSGLIRMVAEAPEGNRNNALFWAACTMAGESPQNMDRLAEAAAAAGLNDREIQATIRSATRRVNQ